VISHMVSELISAVTGPFSAKLGHCVRCTRSASLMAVLVWGLTLLASMAGQKDAATILGAFAASLTMLWVAHLIGAKHHSMVNVILREHGATRAEAKSITAALDSILERSGRDCRRMADGESLHVQLESSTERLTQVSIMNKRGCVAAVSLGEDGTYAESRPSPPQLN
jgi:hypothetical protein